MKTCKECLEQSRLLGMSAEREARLLARIQELERKLINFNDGGTNY